MAQTIPANVYTVNFKLYHLISETSAASRISEEKMRRTGVFFNHNDISLDFTDHTIKAFKNSENGIEKKVPPI
jgi:hypothetical protein